MRSKASKTMDAALTLDAPQIMRSPPRARHVPIRADATIHFRRIELARIVATLDRIHVSDGRPGA